MPGGAVELLSAMLSVEDIAKAPYAKLSLTGGPQKRHGEAMVQWSVPGGAVELLSAMLSVDDIGKALQTRLNPTGGRGAGQRQYGGAVGQRARASMGLPPPYAPAGTLCFNERKYHPYLINIVKCFAAGGDCLIHQTSHIPKFEQQTCRAR